MTTFSCLILMPFDGSFAAVHSVIDNAIRRAGGRAIRCTRIDQVHTPGWIPHEIIRELRSADFCVADVTGWNPNVMWEIGYAMGADTPIIAVVRRGETLPFNVSSFRTIYYDVNELQNSLQTPLEHAVRDTLARAKTDDELLDHLKRTIPLRDRRSVEERFKRRGSVIVRLLLEHHLRPYGEAVRQARHQALPLPSHPRLGLALTAINAARKDVRAVADLANDPWQKPNSEYLEANRAAAERGVKVRRLVLISGDPEMIPAERHAAIEAHRRAGVEVEIAYTDVVRSQRAMTGEDFNPQNTLIVDDTLLTRSGVSSHDGTVYTARDAILAGIEEFEKLWKHVTLNRREGPPRDV